jgi:hypothetical protein
MCRAYADERRAALRALGRVPRSRLGPSARLAPMIERLRNPSVSVREWFPSAVEDGYSVKPGAGPGLRGCNHGITEEIPESTLPGGPLNPWLACRRRLLLQGGTAASGD